MTADPGILAAWAAEARQRTQELIADLRDDQLQVPYLPTLNPLLWEVGHAAYFQEYWVLREGLGHGPLLPEADALFDSIHIDHEARWRLPMPERAAVLGYLEGVRAGVEQALDRGLLEPRELHRLEFSIYHEDMHAEALTYARQTLGYRMPQVEVPLVPVKLGAEAFQDREIAGGAIPLGAVQGGGFCFDNERWAHPVELEPFRIASSAVTEGDFARFVEDGGYGRPDLWDYDGWKWIQAAQADLPLYWRRDGQGALERRHFDIWSPLEPERAMIHVNWYEADAFARWAGRRLPSEYEWELAAQGSDAGQANLDWCVGAPVDVRAFPGGDSRAGCQQMLGNVWEWTASPFRPYPGFEADMYREYSTSSFHTRRVLRGGCWATRSRLMRPSLRNYFQPTRRDVFAGLRTCAREPRP